MVVCGATSFKTKLFPGMGIDALHLCCNLISDSPMTPEARDELEVAQIDGCRDSCFKNMLGSIWFVSLSCYGMDKP